MLSRKPITASDLRRLAQLAQADREEFFHRYPRWAHLYSKRLLCVALCQGAALHYLDGKNGVKDFDVWSFFREVTNQPIRRRRVVHRDFGNAKFGTSPSWPDFIGRPVDLLFKSITCPPGNKPILSLQRYLTEGRTKTARCLAEKAVVIIEPSRLRGKLVWPKKLGESS